jgi:hypothetical protein
MQPIKMNDKMEDMMSKGAGHGDEKKHDLEY